MGKNLPVHLGISHRYELVAYWLDLVYVVSTRESVGVGWPVGTWSKGSENVVTRHRLGHFQGQAGTLSGTEWDKTRGAENHQTAYCYYHHDTPYHEHDHS